MVVVPKLLRRIGPTLSGAIAGFIAARYAPAVLPSAPATAEPRPVESVVQTTSPAQSVHVQLSVGSVKPTLPDADPPEELREDPPTSVFSEERWRAFATEARAEPVHPEWARRTERSLRADLQGLGQSLGFAVHEGRCGTAQCVFTLGWTRATRDVDARL